jgi:TolB protein
MSRSTWFRPGLKGAALVAAALATAAGSAGAALAAPSSHPVKATSLVPLSQVGPGWSIAEYSAASVQFAPHKFKGKTTLYAVNPQGVKFAFYSWPADSPAAKPGLAEFHLVDWSGDRQRALVANGYNKFEEISLATGKVVNSFKLPFYALAIGYTRPDGLNILAVGNQGSVRRYDLTGKLTKILAKTSNGVIDSPDGTTVIVGASYGLNVLSNDAGTVVKKLHAPTAVAICQPVRWWSATTVLGFCVARHGSGAPRLWLFPVNGGRVRALTAQRNGSGEDQGDVDGWQLTSGVYMQALGACGVVFIAKQGPNGQAHRVLVPGVSYASDLIITGHGSSLLVDANNGCPEGATLVWFNPGTKKVTWVFHTPKNTIGVESAVPFGRPLS